MGLGGTTSRWYDDSECGGIRAPRHAKSRVLVRRLAIVAASAFALALPTFPTAAQSVPALMGEVTAGVGSNTTVTSHNYYGGGTTGFFRLAGVVRLGGPGQVRPILAVEHSPSCRAGCGEKLVCVSTPIGGCQHSFPAPTGTAIALGVAAGLGSRIVGAVAAGVAGYEHRAQYVTANASVRLFSHVSAVADARYIWSTDGFGERTWFAPVSGGLRVY